MAERRRRLHPGSWPVSDASLGTPLTYGLGQTCPCLPALPQAHRRGHWIILLATTSTYSPETWSLFRSIRCGPWLTLSILCVSALRPAKTRLAACHGRFDSSISRARQKALTIAAVTLLAAKTIRRAILASHN